MSQMAKNKPEKIGDAAENMRTKHKKKSEGQEAAELNALEKKKTTDASKVSALKKQKSSMDGKIKKVSDDIEEKPKKTAIARKANAVKTKESPMAQKSKTGKQSKESPVPGKVKTGKAKSVIKKASTGAQNENSLEEQKSTEILERKQSEVRINAKAKKENPTADSSNNSIVIKAAPTPKVRTAYAIKRKKSTYARKTITAKMEESGEAQRASTEEAAQEAKTIEQKDSTEAVESEEFLDEEDEANAVEKKRGAGKKKKSIAARRRTTVFQKKKSIFTRKTIALKRGKFTDAPETNSLDMEKELEEEALYFLNEEFEVEEEEELREIVSSTATDWTEDFYIGEDGYLLESNADLSSAVSVESEKDKVVQIVVPHHHHHQQHHVVHHRKHERFGRDFFERLGHVPDLDQISISDSLARELAIARGEIVVRPTKAVKIETMARRPPIESEESSEWSSSSTEFSDIDYDFTSSEEERGVVEMKVKFKEHKLADEEDLFEIFMAKDEAPVVLLGKPDTENYERLQEARQLQQDTTTFLRSLFDAVVEVSDSADREAVLRASLDKVMLFKTIFELLNDIQYQYKINDFLSAKCVMHYRRIRSFGQITPDKAENLSLLMKKYKKAMSNLNCLLGKQVGDNAAISKHVHEAEETITKLEAQLRDLTEQLENLLRRTFHDRKSDILNEIVEHSIKEMSAMREEISVMRCMLIRRQHTEGALVEKIEQHENISDKLSMSDFARMLDQELATVRKIEDKTDRLDKMRVHFYALNNIVAHIRDKQAVDFHAIHAHLDDLADAEAEQRNLRLYNHKLKLRRLHMTKHIQEYSSKCGLLDKPALLVDYDETVELGIKMKRQVFEMKSEIERMEKQISILHEKIKLRR